MTPARGWKITVSWDQSWFWRPWGYWWHYAGDVACGWLRLRFGLTWWSAKQ